MEEKNKKIKFWKIFSGIFLVLFLVSIFTGGFGLKNVFFKLPANKIAGQAVEFINKNLLQAGSAASLVEASCEKKVSLCKFKLNVNNGTFDSYVSSDGKILFPDAIEVEGYQAAAPGAETSTIEDIPQMEKAEVKLFIMSYCPFGLQAQKALLSVMDLLKDKADIKIHFVNYIMHEKKEIDENLRQYCIQKEQTDKLIPYLQCFVAADESEKCLTQANVNQNKLTTCVNKTDKEYDVTSLYEDKESWLNGNFPIFKIDDDLNVQYGVQGSPTMLINEKLVNLNRSPEDYKQAICAGFEVMPEECAQTLSLKTPVAGFGLGEAESSNNASCE